MRDLDFTFLHKFLGLSKFLLSAAGSVSVIRFLQDDSAAIDTEGAVGRRMDTNGDVSGDHTVQVVLFFFLSTPCAVNQR